MTTRRDLLKVALAAILVAPEPAPLTTAIRKAFRSKDPPIQPIGQDFSSAGELQQYIDHIDAYLDDMTARYAGRNARSLAAEVAQQTTRLLALCMAIGNDPRLAGEVAGLLRLEQDSIFRYATIGQERANLSGEINWYDREYSKVLQKHLWDLPLTSFRIPDRVISFDEKMFNTEPALTYVLGAWGVTP